MTRTQPSRRSYRKNSTLGARADGGLEQAKELPPRGTRQQQIQEPIRFVAAELRPIQLSEGGGVFRHFGREGEKRYRKQDIRLARGRRAGLNTTCKDWPEERGERGRSNYKRPRVMPPSRHTRSRHIVPHHTSLNYMAP